MDSYLLDLRRSIKDPLISNNTIKINIFIVKFFPKTRTANFNNIAIEIIRDQRVLNISFNILIKKISKLIKSLLNGKALRLDGILNKVFKAVVLVIVKDLIKTANRCLASKIIPKRLKKSIIVVLRKKKTLLFPKQL